MHTLVTGFENHGTIHCSDTLINGTGEFTPTSIIYPFATVETGHFINRSGATLSGPGTLCVSGTSINEGTLNSQLRFCDTSPTTANWPFLDENTGSVAIDVITCEEGACTVGLAHRPLISGPFIHPNPSNGLFRVDLSSLPTDVHSCVIRDELGREMCRSTLPIDGSIHTDLKSGSYLIEFLDGRGLRTTEGRITIL